MSTVMSHMYSPSKISPLADDGHRRSRSKRGQEKWRSNSSERNCERRKHEKKSFGGIETHSLSRHQNEAKSQYEKGKCSESEEKKGTMFFHSRDEPISEAG
jgi:hypothetical protein